jgi:hypothetical protein
MKTNHTPGPWAYHLGRGANPRFHIQTSAGYQIASTTELERHSVAQEENAQRESNARLIAAAPDLLSVVERFAKWCEQNSVPDIQGIACEAFAVLKKARGE